MASRPEETASEPQADSTTDFDAAFAAAAAEGSEQAPAEEAPAEEAPAEEAPAEEAPAEEAPAEEAPAEEAPADAVLARLAALVNKADTPKAESPTPTEQPAPEQPLYSGEELTLLQEYEANWPDVAKAEGLRRRAEYHDLTKFIFEQVKNFVTPTIEQVAALGNLAHLGELRQAVPDYSESLEAEVAKWVDTQPTYLRSGMKQVMMTGSSEEVADLIGRYRAATGATPQQSSPPAGGAAAGKAPKPAPKTELSSAAKQAAASLAPVSGERTQPVGVVDNSDFDSAFSKYATMLDG